MRIPRINAVPYNQTNANSLKKSSPNFEGATITYAECINLDAKSFYDSFVGLFKKLLERPELKAVIQGAPDGTSIKMKPDQLSNLYHLAIVTPGKPIQTLPVTQAAVTKFADRYANKLAELLRQKA